MRYVLIVSALQAESFDGVPVVLDVLGTRDLTMSHFVHTRLKDPIFGHGSESILAVVRIVTALRDAVKTNAEFFEVADEDFILLEKATRSPSAGDPLVGIASARYSPQLALSLAPFIQAILGAGTTPPRPERVAELGN